MARPRIFVSSTFYDLRQVRADLERFIGEIGFEPVLHERGLIPYGADEKLEEYAYQEVTLSDILISVVGGRFGSPSQHSPYSISQQELRRALTAGKQLHIFIERSVHSEYNTYILNRSNPDVRYRYVDDVRVFKFIEELYALPNNNPIAQFESAQDITDYLREQWAGLFQRFLQEQRLRRDLGVIEGIQATAATLNQLVTFLTEERRNRDQAIQDILLSNHPAFQAFRTTIRAQYRLYSSNRTELLQYLESRGWTAVLQEAWDHSDYEEWIHNVAGDRNKYWLLQFWTGMFDEEGKLRIYTAADWHDEWVRSDVRDRQAEIEEVDPDDIPF